MLLAVALTSLAAALRFCALRACMFGWLWSRLRLLCLLRPWLRGTRGLWWPHCGTRLCFLLMLLALHVLLLAVLLFLLLPLLLLTLPVGTLFVLPLLVLPLFVLTLLIHALFIGGIGACFGCAGVIVALITLGSLSIRWQLRRRTGWACLRCRSRVARRRLRAVATIFVIARRSAVRARPRRLG